MYVSTECTLAQCLNEICKKTVKTHTKADTYFRVTVTNYTVETKILPSYVESQNYVTIFYLR